MITICIANMRVNSILLYKHPHMFVISVIMSLIREQIWCVYNVYIVHIQYINIYIYIYKLGTYIHDDYYIIHLIIISTCVQYYY